MKRAVFSMVRLERFRWTSQSGPLGRNNLIRFL